MTVDTDRINGRGTGGQGEQHPRCHKPLPEFGIHSPKMLQIRERPKNLIVHFINILGLAIELTVGLLIFTSRLS